MGDGVRGWERKKIGEVLKLEYGKPLPKESRNEAGNYVAYGANGVKCRTNEYYWDKPSIIIGRKGSAGEVNLTEERFWPLDVTYFVVFDDQKYDLKFLYYCLNCLNLTSLAKGVKPGINRNDVYALETAFPPLPEQKRIVAILDEAFAGIDAAVANTEKNLTNARELFESYLNGVFTRKGDGWVEKKLVDVVDSRCSLSYGIVQPGNEFTDGLPIVRPTDLTQKNISITGLKRINPELAESYKRTSLNGGELLLCVRGSTGTVSVATAELEGVNVTRGIVPIQFDTSLIRQDFGYYAFISGVVQNQIKEGTYGAALMQINIRDLKNILVPFPQLFEQKKLLAGLNAIAEQTQRLESIYQQKLTALAELKQSILQKAFAGELIKQPEKTVAEAAG